MRSGLPGLKLLGLLSPWALSGQPTRLMLYLPPLRALALGVLQPPMLFSSGPMAGSSTALRTSSCFVMLSKTRPPSLPVAPLCPGSINNIMRVIYMHAYLCSDTGFMIQSCFGLLPASLAPAIMAGDRNFPRLLGE